MVFVFCVMAFPVWAGNDVEIYAGGNRYDSIKSYKIIRDAEAKKEEKAATIKEEIKLSPEQASQLQVEAKIQGVEVDPQKIKTIAIKPQLSEETADKLAAISANGDLPNVVADFEQGWDNPQPHNTVSADQLGEKIRAAVGDRKEPVLLISDPKKMRIMALSPQEAKDWMEKQSLKDTPASEGL